MTANSPIRCILRTIYSPQSVSRQKTAPGILVVADMMMHRDCRASRPRVVRAARSWPNPESTAYSMTSSARVSSVVGTVKSRVLAIFRFKANSNTVGCSIGISRGVAPRNIFAIWSAMRLRSSVRFGPYPIKQPSRAISAHSHTIGNLASSARPAICQRSMTSRRKFISHLYKSIRIKPPNRKANCRL